MQTKAILNTLFLAAALSSKVLAFDGPARCASVCQQLGQAEDRCDDAFNDNQVNEYNACICQATGATEAIPLCAACWYEDERATDPDDTEAEWRDNDANSLLARCTVASSSTYDLANASPTQTVVAALTTSGGSTVVPTGTASSSSSTITGSSPSPSPTSPTSSSGTNSPTGTTTGSTTSSTPNAAPTMGAGDMSFMAGAGLLMAAALM